MRPRLSAFILACVHLSLGSVKYTILPSSFVGQFGGSEEVKNVDQCSARAHRSNKIAFRVELKEKQMFCSMLEGFRSFEAKRGDNVRDYVLDTSKDASICYGKGEQNVIKLVSGACSAGRKGCGMLKDMNTYCQFVGRDIPNCVSGKGDTIDQAKCPEKHTFIGIEKEALLCCPPQTSFVKESNKKALCCPSNTQLEQEINGRAVCCPDGTKFQREENGKDLCCPKNTVLKGTSEGKPVCCPANYNLNQGWTHCCPEGFAFKQSFKKCVGIVSMAAKPPQTTDELKQHCTDKENSVPVKIENVDQNRDVLDVIGNEDALIGLYVPRALYKMHWIVDNSKTDYNNMNTIDKEHTFGDKGEHFGKMQSKVQQDPGIWYIVNPQNLPANVVCVAPTRDGMKI